MRRRILIPATIVATLASVPSAALAAKPSTTCPPAFDLGLVTLAEDLALPKTIAGLEAGALTLDEIVAFHELVDRSGDGLCFQTIPPSGVEPAPWRYDYNVVDNNASVPE
jgi:hypothetical protein